MKWISALWFNQTIRAAAAIMAASFLGAALASAQTEVPLFTYPITTSNTTGIVWPGLVTQGGR